MNSRPPFVFKIASEDWEFEQIHRLNYRTFVEEIPQHKASPSHRLVDKFHAENTYIICLSGSNLAGMLAVRGSRPFSLDHKLPNLSDYIPSGCTPCEIRLLAIERRFRGAQVLQGMLALLWQHIADKSYSFAMISGTTSQLKLYHHLGFVPFGPLVGHEGAQFQPMHITLDTFETTAREFVRSQPARAFQPASISFLPGPVPVRRDVRRAFEQAGESHRGDAFVRDFNATRELVAKLANAAHVQFLMGSGTLANDVVAAQLSLIEKPGLILSNGEFGERLVDHATRFGLRFQHAKWEWGEPLDYEGVERMARAGSPPAWLWCVHCETSTGVLNDIERLTEICREHSTRLCLDCVSSLGAVPVSLESVYLASAASGKGLRSYSGVAMVFHNHAPAPEPNRLPRYLDLGYYAQKGIPFSFSSNLVHALHAAVQRIEWEKRFAQIETLATFLRRQLEALGFQIVSPEKFSSPAVFSLRLPGELDSSEFGRLLHDQGFLVHHNGEYLKPRNWIQICLMSDCSEEKIIALCNAMNRVRGRMMGRKLPGEATLRV